MAQTITTQQAGKICAEYRKTGLSWKQVARKLHTNYGYTSAKTGKVVSDSCAWLLAKTYGGYKTTVPPVKKQLPVSSSSSKANKWDIAKMIDESSIEPSTKKALIELIIDAMNK